MENRYFPSLTYVKHSLAQHKLAYLRDKECSTNRFRELMREIGMFITYEITYDLELKHATVKVDESSQKTDAYVISENAVIIPILRAGLVLAEGALEVIPTAKVGHLGIGRSVKTGEAIPFMISIPEPRNRLFVLLDPVIGTGRTACLAIKILKDLGINPKNIRFGTVLVAPEGMQRIIDEKHDDVSIFTVQLEQGLDVNQHVMPGFGHAGDRLFGT